MADIPSWVQFPPDSGPQAGILGSPSSPTGGLLWSAPSWLTKLGIFGAGLADAGATLGGHPADANNAIMFQQVKRQNQLRQAYATAATSNDPQAAQQANALILANGGDPTAIQKYRANQAMPDLLNLMKPQTQYSLDPKVAQQIQSGQTTNAPPTISTTPGLSLADALPKLNNPYVSQQLAPMMMDAQIAAQAKMADPYTLEPGASRFVGGTQIASAPLKPTPNEPFNPDGTPNKAYQDYEANKAAPPDIVRTSMYLFPNDPAKQRAYIQQNSASVVKGIGAPKTPSPSGAIVIPHPGTGF